MTEEERGELVTLLESWDQPIYGVDEYDSGVESGRWNCADELRAWLKSH